MKKFATAAAVLAVAIAFAAPAQALVNQDNVYDKRGNPVLLGINKSCVLTTWEDADARCAGRAAAIDLADRTFFFDFDSAKLSGEATAKLDKLAGMIKEMGEGRKVSVTGFADRLGNTAYNNKLSLRRAQAVASYLAAQGIESDQVVSVAGAGESNVTNCKTGANLKSCLRPDRRVEVTIK